MTKTLIEATVSTRNARSKLSEGLHWRGLNADVHLGYRKGKRAGRWLVRWYVGAQKYQQETIGVADDALDADGDSCLTFEQAKTKAVAFVSERKTMQRAEAQGPVATVRSVVSAYIAARDAREAARDDTRSKSDARHRLTKHVLSSPIADRELYRLTESDLTEWRDGLAEGLAAGTVRRLVNDFKAALNAGAAKYRGILPAEVPVIIKSGLASKTATAPVARDKQALADADIRRLIEAAKQIDDADEWGGDLLRLVATLAATGARFSQVRRLAVSDVQLAHSRIMMPVSRKGRGDKNSTHTAIRIGSDVASTLRPAIAGRRSGDVLLERWHHKQVAGENGKKPRWERERRAAWSFAAEMARPWQQIVKAAGLPADTVPYALRHSSIVRQLRAGLPVRLVAALHDTSTRMIETHYAAAIVDALDELSAGAVIPLVSEEQSKVVPLRAS
jgi:integrase